MPIDLSICLISLYPAGNWVGYWKLDGLSMVARSVPHHEDNSNLYTSIRIIET